MKTSSYVRINLERSMMEQFTQMMPCREKQWKLLARLLDGETAPNCIYLYGNTATGKTYITTTILKLLKIDFVRINCVEYDSIPLLVSAISSKISELYIDEEKHKKCSTLMDMVYMMAKVSEDPEKNTRPFVIVLERCERLRCMPSYAQPVLPALLKLKELSGMNICTIMISGIVWEKFYSKTWFIKPIKIFFPQYSKDDMFQIISTQLPDDVPQVVFDAYVKLVINFLYRVCRDLNEFQFVVYKHLPQIKDFTVDFDPQKMFRALCPHLKESALHLHLRGTGVKNPTNQEQQLNPLTSSVSGLELPYYAKYLLIASFLASYNAPKHDKRLFMKFHGKEKKRLASKARKVKMSSLLVGPKSFSFERLVAIFNAISEESGLSTSLCAQLTTLINLKLINRVGYSNLSDPKYSCAVGLGYISDIGSGVGFNVAKYIMEDN